MTFSAVHTRSGPSAHGSDDRRARAGRVVALIGLSLTFGLVQLDATVVNVALDAVGRDLGGGVGLAQWLVDAYAVPFAALLLVGGAVGDRFGHRRTCVAGFVLFGLASIPAAAAGSWAILLSARVAQGVGAALMLPSSLALVGELYPDRRERARALGVWGGIATLGFASGPLVGGLLLTGFSWPAIFWINLPLCLVVGGTVAWFAPVDRPQPRHLDRTGSLLAVAALAALVAAVITAGQGDLALAALLAVAALVLVTAFVLVERHVAHPLVPAEVVRAPGLAWSLLVGFGFNFAMYGGLLAVSLTLQSGHGFSSLAGGLAVLPMAVIVFLGASSSGPLTASLGPRRPMVVGLLLGVVGAAVLAGAGVVDSAAATIAGLAGVGLISLAMPAMTSVALNAVGGERAGLASGALNTTRQMGGAVGVAVLGALLNAFGYGSGLAIAGISMLVVLLLAFGAAMASTRKATA